MLYIPVLISYLRCGACEELLILREKIQNVGYEDNDYNDEMHNLCGVISLRRRLADRVSSSDIIAYAMCHIRLGSNVGSKYY